MPANKTVKVKRTFKAAGNANSVYFGLGGDVGDRRDVSTDADAVTRTMYSRETSSRQQK